MSKAGTITVEIWNDEVQRYIEVQAPARWEVCERCGGDGSTSEHLGVFFSDDPYLQDEQFMEDYAAGKFDQPCPKCDGRRVVAVLDEMAATPKEIEAYEEMLFEEAQYRAEVEAERRAGA